MRWLVDSWDHRDPQDDLHDIDCGRYLQALHTLPQNLRQLIEENSLYVELQEIDGRYHIVKITKKREAEFLQNTEQFFVYDNEGNRISLTEKEFDDLLDIKHNPDDLFETSEIQLETLDSQYSASMDVWDILFDASEYIKEAKAFIKAWNEGKINSQLIINKDPIEHLKYMQDTGIYSADWFPYAADKRLHSDRAKKIAEAIFKHNLTKSQLGAMIGPREANHYVRSAKAMQAKAKLLKPGKEKANLLIKAQKLLLQTAKEFKNKQLITYSSISNSDRNKLWNLWKSKEIQVNKEIKLTSWQFERWYKVKLQREIEPKIEELQQAYNIGSISQDKFSNKVKDLKYQMSIKLKERMEKLYQQKPANNDIVLKDLAHKSEPKQLQIAWLDNAREIFAKEKDLYAPEPEENIEETKIFTDWLPDPSLLEYPEITDTEWNTIILAGE